MQIIYRTCPNDDNVLVYLDKLGQDNWIYCGQLNDKLIFRKERKERQERKTITDDTFEGFWKLYPNKKAKKDALIMWNRLETKDKTLAVEGLERYIIYWKKKQIEKQYLPHPATWINGRRWEDNLSDDVVLTKPIQNIQDELSEDRKHREEKARIDKQVWNLQQDPVKWKQAQNKALSELTEGQRALSSNIVESLVLTRIRMKINTITT